MSHLKNQELLEALWELAEELAYNQGGNDYMLSKLAVGIGPLEELIASLRDEEYSEMLVELDEEDLKKLEN